jgi:hypothetical protein
VQASSLHYTVMMRPGAESFPTTSHGAPMAAPNSPWQSPVPYLFGGLAAMLGLIALALLILACSYWKLSGYLDAGRDQRAAGEAAGADGEKGSATGAARPAAGVREHVVVIMAGEDRPTFLATPAASRAVAELGAGSGEEEEEKERARVDDGGGCEQERPRLGADAGTVSRSSASATALAE